MRRSFSLRAPGRLSVLGLGVALVALGRGVARAEVSDPHPGLRLVKRPSQTLAIADLCAPGVSVRATKQGERGKTAPQWAAATGVHVAINGDFFDLPNNSFAVWGRARGASEDWAPGQHFRQAAAGEFRQYLAFGLGTMLLETNSAVEPPAPPFATEIIGGHIGLIHEGKSLAPFGDILAESFAARQRTAVGFSQDKKRLYLFTSQKNLKGQGIVDDMSSMVAEGGAPAMWEATSLDGGGSTQMFVAGQGAVLASSRQVSNHLGVYASGSGTSWQCPNKPPRGSLDAAGCEFVTGWAQDEDHPDAQISVKIAYAGAVGAEPTTVTVPANEHRDDLCGAIGSCVHGFKALSPYSLHDGAARAVLAAGVDDGGGTVFIGEARTLTCATPAPKGERRWVTNPDVLAAWRFSLFEGALPGISDAVIDALPQLDDVPAKPRLVKATDNDAVFVVLGKQKRHIPSPRVLADWHFEGGTIEVLPPAEVAAMPTGPALRSRPMLVVRSSGHVYLVDDGEVPSGAGGAAGSGGKAAGGQGGKAAGGHAGKGAAGGQAGGMAAGGKGSGASSGGAGKPGSPGGQAGAGGKGGGGNGSGGAAGSAGKNAAGRAGSGPSDDVEIAPSADQSGACSFGSGGGRNGAAALLALAALARARAWRRHRKDTLSIAGAVNGKIRKPAPEMKKLRTMVASEQLTTARVVAQPTPSLPPMVESPQ